MPEFSYRGKNKEGISKIGKRTALSADQLGSLLIREGITPIEITEVRTQHNLLSSIVLYFENQTAYLQELSIFAKQMELLHKASVPIVMSLKQLARYTRNQRLSQGITGVAEHLERGEDFASALKNYPNAFPEFFINIIEIGQNTGQLNQSFSQIHSYLEFEIQNKKQTQGSLRYPKMLLLTVVFSIIGLNYFVIPTFSQLFENFRMQLPWETVVLITLSNFFVHYGPHLLVASIISFFLFYNYIKNPTGRRKWHRFLLSLPVYGNLLKTLSLVRFCHGLSIAIHSGLPLIKGLTLSVNLVENQEIKDRITSVITMVESGKSFTQSITQTKIFNDLELQIFSVSEQNGELASSLSFIAEFYSHELEHTIKKLSESMGPILIGFISILVLLLAIGIYLPIWDMVKIAK